MAVDGRGSVAPGGRAAEPGTQTLLRALQIIGLVSERPGLAASAIALALGVHRSTAYRICATLESLGYLERVPGGEGSRRPGYRLGLWVFVLGSRAVSALALKRQAPPILRRLVQQAHLPAYLSVVWNGVSVCIEEVPGPAGSVWLGSAVGNPLPVYASASGKLYLAQLPEAEARAHLARAPFLSLAPNTPAGPEAVLAGLDRVRAQGYAFNDEETEYGVRYVGVAVRSPDGTFLAGLTVGATVEQRTPEQLAALVPALRAAAAALAARVTRPLPPDYLEGPPAPPRLTGRGSRPSRARRAGVGAKGP
jgi:DNA-binding IclR family transcriptional regulator